MDPQLIAYLDTRFGQIASRFESFDTRFDQLEGRFDQLEARFDQLEARIGQLETRIGQLETRMGQLEVRLGSLETRFGQLETRVGMLEARIGQLEVRLDRVEETGRQTLVMVEGLRHEVHLVAEGFVGLDERLKRHQSDNAPVYDQVRSWIQPAFESMDSRVKILEGRSDTRHLDVLEAVRQMLARKPAPMPVISE